MLSRLVPCWSLSRRVLCAANEPYELWEDLDRRSKEYKDLKQERAQALWEVRDEGVFFVL